MYQPISRGKNLLFGILLLNVFFITASCSYYYAESSHQASQVRVMEITPDSTANALILPYKSSLDGEMNAIVAEIGNEMRKSKPESALGNFICDVIVKQGELVTGNNIDFGVYNYGGIRQDVIAEGPITKGKIFELLPFENFGAIVTLDGPSTLLLIQKIIDEEGWPVSGELQIVVKNNLPEKILINGAPFDITKSYVVVMNDYMAGGGDNSAFLTGQKVDVLGVTIRAMMLNYLSAETAAGRKIYSKTEGRIVYAD
ncbi:MAG: 5'-nucleotidase C-terminal domain-containing protein [Bacteroidetes bacterium]|nr:5'-nucleotidase C-terminal domain-containing protein [Bacteroidota bacterium]